MRSDVVIIGGGPAGAACALALARGGARCILLERSPSPGWKAGEVIDARVQAPLRELGVWEEFAARAYLRSAGTVSAWGPEVEEKSATASPYGGSFLVDRADLESMLLGSAVRAGASVLQGAQARTAERAGSGWLIHVRRGPEMLQVWTPLLIEATGRGQSLTGRGERVRVDALVALMAYPSAGPVPDLRFSIEAVPDGWWYAAALPQGKAVLAFMTDADLLPAGSAARNRFFLWQLERSPLMRSRFSPASLTGRVRVAPAMSTIRRTLCGDGWVALGDAAATYDPLAGMGVTVALNKGLALARLLLSEPGATAFARYVQAERAAFDDHLSVRRSIYQGEPRWPGAPFWHRRA